MSYVNPVIAAPSEPAFHDLLLAMLPALRQQALALTRHRADADDLVQAAVTNARAAQNSFTPGTNFRAWMIRIMRNRFFSNLRRRREVVGIEAVPPAQLSRSGGQEDNLAIQELTRNLLRLPVDQRLILVMISVQGLSYEEASQQLRVAVGTLKCRVFRARAQLQVWMTGEEVSTRAVAQRPTLTKAAGKTHGRKRKLSTEGALPA